MNKKKIHWNALCFNKQEREKKVQLILWLQSAMKFIHLKCVARNWMHPYNILVWLNANAGDSMSKRAAEEKK